MQASEIIAFYTRFALTTSHRWSEEQVNLLAQQAFPEDVIGPRKWLLRADANMAHARWFLESLCDTAAFDNDESLGFLHLVEKIRDAVRLIDQHLPDDELAKVIEALGAVAWRDIEGRRLRRRAAMTASIKSALWFESDPDQRCYLCGYKFTAAARDLFLGRSRVKPAVPRLIDFTRPRTKVRHLCVEIDHMHPVAEGGSNDLENLRLACGLCNIVKSRFGSIYDAYSWPARVFRHPNLGWVTIPQPLWLIRVISLRQRCEHREGCSATLKTHELFASPWSPNGSLNPVNIKVSCVTHDPWATTRLIAPALLAAAGQRTTGS